MNREARRAFDRRFHELVCREALGQLTPAEGPKLDRYQNLRRSLLRCSGECPRQRWRERFLIKSIRLALRKSRCEVWSPIRPRWLMQIEDSQS